VTGRVRRWYRIGAAATAVIAVAALLLGASGQLFAPGVAPSTTKAVLAQETGTQNPSPQAAAGGAADDAPCRRDATAWHGPRPPCHRLTARISHAP
jgi:hypothetical protein